MNQISINFETPVKMYGNSVALATVEANNENEAGVMLDAFLAEQHPDLGRADAHYSEGNLYWFSVNN